jgi:flagella basal body P-ring formation protein FlgA
MLIALMAAAALHPCAPVHGDRILMRDLAGVDARFSTTDPSQVAGYAPGPGATRVFWPAELINIAKRNGIATDEVFQKICFEWPMRQLTAPEIVSAIRVWAPEGAAIEIGAIEIGEQSKFSVPFGELTVPRPASASPALDGTILLRGFVTFGGAQHFPTWARVRLRIKQTVVVALADIDAATEIRAEQLRVEERECGIESAQFLSSIAQVTGKYAKRRMIAGNPVLLTALEEPKPVMRGAVVKVEVRDGGAFLAFDGRAEESGRAGETVKVRNPSSGKDFAARVTGLNRVLVTPEGSQSEVIHNP